MIEKITQLIHRSEELTARLCDPRVASSAEECTAVMKQLKELEPLTETGRAYLAAHREREEVRSLLKSETDPELLELARSEEENLSQRCRELEEQLRLLMLPKDEHDDRSVVVEIRAGAGGEEAALFAAVLYRMYSMYAVKKGWTSEIVSVNETELGGFKEISFLLGGQGVYSRLKFESGVHRVQRVPETETQGRIHTSTVTVAVLPEAEEVEVHIDPADLRIDTFRASGAGGQHINKTESAIRITHLPTGLVVECQDERSQYKNKDRAMKVLRSRLLDRERSRQEQALSSERRSQVGTGDRSERIRTYNYPQGRVTDHRIGLTLYKIEEILNGSLDEVTEALLTADRAARLAQAEKTADEAAD